MTSVTRPRACPPVLLPFVEADVLDAADVHVASVLGRTLGEDRPEVLLAAALAARAPRVGHTCLDVAGVADAVVEEVPADGDLDRLARLPWPDPGPWLEAVATSPLVAPVDGIAPLVVEDGLVWLERTWQLEVRLAGQLRRRAASAVVPDEGRLQALLDRLFPAAEPDDRQRRAAEQVARRRLLVLAGGPGTGKTWTVARLLAVLVDQGLARGQAPRIALAAPTGKAAARLDEGLREALDDLDVPAPVREVLASLDRGRTVHRLLGRRGTTRFWHDADRPLPHDVVVVDETSMASLGLAAALLDAIRRDATVVLVGDPDQLASVEAGSVLGDVVRGAGHGPLADSLVVLDRPRRFGATSGIGVLARAVAAADEDAVLAALEDRDDLALLPLAEPTEAQLAEVREVLVASATARAAAARDRDAASALARLGEVVVLCAHRRGPDGVAGWNARVDRWMADGVPGWLPGEPWQPGRAVLATTNDAALGIFNGDLGVVVADPGGDDGVGGAGATVRLAFPGRAGLVAPSRVEGAQPVQAMTVHKAQGSQWDHVVVVLPSRPSRVVTRELLYTAVTRASGRVTVIGDPEVVRAAVRRPIRRASGLARRLAAPRPVGDA